MRARTFLALVASVIFSVAVVPSLQFKASAASAVPKEQVKTFVCDKDLTTCAPYVDKLVNDWLADNPSVVIVERKVTLAVGGVFPNVANAYAITLFYSGGRP